jgi:ribosomal protein S18 acetylase RimI-like enzyme
MELLYRAMDLFVLPSHREGFPRAAMEAATMGLPIVATDIRGCREVVDQGANGVLFPVGDVAALTKAIQEIASDPRLRKRMSVAAREKARACFDERRVVEIVMDSYRRAAAAKGLPWPASASGEVEIRPASTTDAPVLARLHRGAIATGFLSQLGHRFLTILYRALIGWEEAVVLVADQGVVVGFVAGVTHTGRFYRYLVSRYGLQALWAALPRLVRPRVLRRAWETWRYGSDGAIEAELLSTATATSAQRKGIGKRLGREFLAVMATKSVPAVKVVLGSDNQAARALYEALGFVETRRIEVHTEEESLEMMWSSSQL